MEKKRGLNKQLKVIWEYESSKEAELRLEQAFNMLLSCGAIKKEASSENTKPNKNWIPNIIDKNILV